MAGMRYRVFVSFNVIGALLWAAGVTALGAWLGQFTFIKEHIDLILIGIVLVSVLPMAITGITGVLDFGTTIFTWQCSQIGAIRWIAHSNESKTCTAPAAWTSKLSR